MTSHREFQVQTMCHRLFGLRSRTKTSWAPVEVICFRMVSRLYNAVPTSLTPMTCAASAAIPVPGPGERSPYSVGVCGSILEDAYGDSNRRSGFRTTAIPPIYESMLYTGSFPKSRYLDAHKNPVKELYSATPPAILGLLANQKPLNIQQWNGYSRFTCSTVGT